MLALDEPETTPESVTYQDGGTGRPDSVNVTEYGRASEKLVQIDTGLPDTVIWLVLGDETKPGSPATTNANVPFGSLKPIDCVVDASLVPLIVTAQLVPAGRPASET